VHSRWFPDAVVGILERHAAVGPFGLNHTRSVNRLRNRGQHGAGLFESWPKAPQRRVTPVETERGAFVESRLAEHGATGPGPCSRRFGHLQRLWGVQRNRRAEPASNSDDLGSAGRPERIAFSRIRTVS